MPDGKIPFDPSLPDLDTARQIVIERLRRDTSWKQLDSTGEGFAPYVEYIAQNEPQFSDAVQHFRSQTWKKT